MKKSSPRKFSMLALIFLLISIPLAIYALINLPSLDTRNKAADLTADIETCQITFPFVNPASIEVNKKVQTSISAVTKGEAISQVMVMDRTGAVIFKQEYKDGRDTISEKFIFEPKSVGDFGIMGTLTTDKGTRPCVVSDRGVVRVVSTNIAPTFKTQVTQATPSNSLKVNEAYQYQLQAEDIDNDTINFAFSFTPDATWLKSTVIENGTNGKLTIKFSGTPDKPGSYLANIFIHDGYNAHLSAQTWIISVAQDKNDIPKVSVIQPSSDIKIKKGEKLNISWEAADLNLITKYELYIATNPGNSNTWKEINKNVGPKVGNYVYDTKDLTPGIYQVIVKAFDNFNPPAEGLGLSAKITVGDADSGGTDDGVVLQEAQITNISPSNESSIKNKIAAISATLVPGKDAKVKKETIKIVFDDQDITKDTRINEVLDNQYSILYNPQKEYSEGQHKVVVSFEDTKGNKAEKAWTFTIIPEDSASSDNINIFGFSIPKRIAIIVVAGLAILILALIIPWLLYLAWRGAKNEDDYEEIYEKTTPPDGGDTFVFTGNSDNQKSDEEEIKVEEKIAEEEKESTKKPFGPMFNLSSFKKEVAKPEEKTDIQTAEPVVSDIEITQPEEEKVVETAEKDITTTEGVVQPTLQPQQEPTQIETFTYQPEIIPTPVETTIPVENDLTLPNPTNTNPLITPAVQEIEVSTPRPVVQTNTQTENSLSPISSANEIDTQPQDIVQQIEDEKAENSTMETDTQPQEIAQQIEDETTRELEALAEKLRKKEETLNEFLGTNSSDTAPSSTPLDTNQTPIAPQAEDNNSNPPASNL